MWSVCVLYVFCMWSVCVLYVVCSGGTRWRSWLRHCPTSRKVAGSIPDYVIVIFQWHNPSGRAMALGLTQPLTEMSTRNIFCGGKGGRCVGLTTLPPSCVAVLKSGNLKLLEPSGPLQACNGNSLSFFYLFMCPAQSEGMTVLWLFFFLIFVGSRF